ncbi:hypothetical protein [Nonomuraea sp. NPDC003214]
MNGTAVAGESALRRVAYLVVVLVAGVALLAGVLMLAPGKQERAALENERFVRSAAAMEEVARTLGEGDELGARNIGELSFETIHREDDLVYFAQGRDMDNQPYGYVWTPPGGPHWTFAEREDVRPVRGPWFEYHLNVNLTAPGRSK